MVLLSSQAVAVTPLAVWVDVDGTSYLWNTTEAPLSFDGYQIVSFDGTLDPVGWDSIADRVPARIEALFAALGTGAVTFGEAAPTSLQLAELNLPGVGTLAGGAKFSLGKPFATLPPSQGTVGFWSGASLGGSLDIVFAPEPSGWLLASLAAFCCWAMQRRR